MKKLILASILALTPSLAQADDTWFHVTSTDDGTHIYALKKDLMKGRSHQTVARVWVRMDSRKDPTVSFNEARTLYAVNCVAGSYRTISTIITMPDGRIHNETSRDLSVRFAAPDSNIGSVIELLCSDPSGDGI